MYSMHLIPANALSVSFAIHAIITSKGTQMNFGIIADNLFALHEY